MLTVAILPMLGIGDLSTDDASIGCFHSPAIEAVAIVFMTVAGINVSLHFFAWNRRSLLSYWHDAELRLYLSILFGVALLVSAILAHHPDSSGSPVREGIFHAVSMATTTGYTTTNFSLWPAAAPVLLIVAAGA